MLIAKLDLVQVYAISEEALNDICYIVNIVNWYKDESTGNEFLWNEILNNLASIREEIHKIDDIIPEEKKP